MRRKDLFQQIVLECEAVIPNTEVAHVLLQIISDVVEELNGPKYNYLEQAKWLDNSDFWTPARERRYLSTFLRVLHTLRAIKWMSLVLNADKVIWTKVLAVMMIRHFSWVITGNIEQHRMIPLRDKGKFTLYWKQLKQYAQGENYPPEVHEILVYMSKLDYLMETRSTEVLSMVQRSLKTVAVDDAGRFKFANGQWPTAVELRDIREAMNNALALLFSTPVTQDGRVLSARDRFDDRTALTQIDIGLPASVLDYRDVPGDMEYA